MIRDSTSRLYTAFTCIGRCGYYFQWRWFSAAARQSFSVSSVNDYRQPIALEERMFRRLLEVMFPGRDEVETQKTREFRSKPSCSAVLQSDNFHAAHCTHPPALISRPVRRMIPATHS